MLSFLDDLALKYNMDLDTTRSKWNNQGTYLPVITKVLESHIGDWVLNLEYEYRQHYITKASAKQILTTGDPGFNDCDKHNVLLKCRIAESKFNIPFTIQRKNFLNQLFSKKTNKKFHLSCKNKRFRTHLLRCKILDQAYTEKGFNPIIQTWNESGNFHISTGYEGQFGVAEKEALFTFNLGKELIEHIENFQ